LFPAIICDANGGTSKRHDDGDEHSLFHAVPPWTYLPDLELHSQHELNLPGQSGARVRRGGIVIVVVKVVGGVDYAKIRSRRGYESLASGIARVRYVVQLKVVRVAKLDVIEDVEELHSKLDGESLGYLRFLYK
jgi:hypothetical protein